MAFSRPNQFLIRMGYPLVRRMQKKFGRDSAKAMFNAFGEVGKLPAIQQASS